MPTLFLATLYEYSPLFYITVVFICLCFTVTTGLLLGWFGIEVPVILRNSEETDSINFVSKRQMKQVKNPFGLEILNPDAASLSTGITLMLNCLENCTLTCYWGCSVLKLQEALQKHVYCSQIRTPRAFEDTLYSEYIHKEQHEIQKQSKEELYIQLSEDHIVEDFGPVPRNRYPLIALLTLTYEEDQEQYDIVSMLTVVHIPDRRYRLPCRIMYQYILTAEGQFYDLKQLFMSANHNPSESTSEYPIQDGSGDGKLLEKLGLSEDEFQEDIGKDCVVCQNDTINWVLLPCRHTCLCDGCLKYFQHCPICRQFVEESFQLHVDDQPASHECDLDPEDSTSDLRF